MLYIFHVNTGRMLTFEMSLALDTVQSLKDCIERQHGINAAHQVLLISGGEILQPEMKVFSYTSGTDTNPIFMFSTSFTDARNPPHLWPSIESDNDFKEQVAQCLKLPAKITTVSKRAQLAMQMHDIATTELKTCEKLVYEQHLQQQGWAAVIANMEDLIEEFKQRFADFYRCFDEHLQIQASCMGYLEHYKEALQILAKIPLSQSLLIDSHDGFNGFDEFFDGRDSFTISDTDGGAAAGTGTEAPSEDSETSKSNVGVSEFPMDDLQSSNQSQPPNKTKGSLLNWITLRKSHTPVNEIADNCLKSMQMFDDKSIAGLKDMVESAIKSAQQDEMREVRGLTRRLEGLDKLLFEARQLMQDQNVHATSFQQNQTRAAALDDESIIPDLCESHYSQLAVMLENHTKLRDIRRRVTKAKEELAFNLVGRLKYVIHLENRMSELDSKLLFYNRNLRRVQRHLVIIEQMHNAPTMYVHAIAEVIRRKTFASSYLKWASALAANLLRIYQEEVARRNEFQALFDGHFLNALFLGMDDMPPAYAIEAPSAFDSSLPNLTVNDLEVLSNILPEVTSKIILPDLSAVISFFLSTPTSTNTINEHSGLPMGNTNKPQQDEANVTSSATTSVRPLYSHLKDQCDSETDTEEFEKVGQSPLERRQQMSSLAMDQQQSSSSLSQPMTTAQDGQVVRPQMASISTSTELIEMKTTETLTEENLGATRLEVERLKDLLAQMHQTCKSSVTMLRERIHHIKHDSDANRAAVESEFEKIAETWDKIKDETQNREREVINRLTVDHELELNDIKKYLLAKDEEIDTLKSDQLLAHKTHTKLLNDREADHCQYDRSLVELNVRVIELEQRLAKSNDEKVQAVNDMKDSLTREYKTELESLRSRFKLMTNMERSPSDTSLEKIERPDYLDIIPHDVIHVPGSAAATGVAQQRLSSLGGASSPRSPTKSTDMFRQILEDKEQQLDALRMREQMLSQENQRYKETIQKLAESEQNEKEMLSLREHLNALQSENVVLQQQLSTEKTKRQEMESSVTVDKSALLTSTSKDLITSTSASSVRSSRCSRRSICTESCARGDYVIIFWNAAHGQYTLLQDGHVLYFLHAESHAALNLEVPTSSTSGSGQQMPDVLHSQSAPFVGKVIEKEYCYARKDENRYKVTRGTKFYRVKVRPRSPAKCTEPKCCTKRERHDSDRSICSVSSLTMTSSTAPVITTVASAPANTSLNVIDSSAQTDFKSILDVDITSQSIIDRDMVDSGVQQSVCSGSSYKERNISVTDDDEPLSITSDRCRYVSVCEEDENIVDTQSCEVKEIAEHLNDDTPPVTLLSDIDQDDSDEYRSLDNMKDEFLSVSS